MLRSFKVWSDEDGQVEIALACIIPSFVITGKPSREIPEEARHLGDKKFEGVGVILPAGNMYGALVDSLLYMANSTRPDIATATSILSQPRGSLLLGTRMKL